MSHVLERLTAWRPSMELYHRHPALNSGFLSRAHSEVGEGLSTALYERAATMAEPWGPTTQEELVNGIVLHAWVEDDPIEIHHAPVNVRARRGDAWAAAVDAASAKGAHVVVLREQFRYLEAAWLSLVAPRPGMDTPAKAYIRAMMREWGPRVPEVSHVWTPFEGAATCKIREDFCAYPPPPRSGVWHACQIKTTREALTARRWWPLWRRHYRRASALYREGLRDLFQGEPFRQVLIVARLVPPYPWALFSLEERADEIEECWAQDVRPEIERVSAAIAAGRMYGPEECGPNFGDQDDE